jgi:hypothetical protein
MSRSSLSRFPGAKSRAVVAEHFPHANRYVVSRQENGPDSDSEGEFRYKPEFTPLDFLAAF